MVSPRSRHQWEELVPKLAVNWIATVLFVNRTLKFALNALPNFFLANENLPCIACPIINGCQACQDFKGCSQCSNASDLTQNTYLYGEIPYQLYDCNQGLDYSAMSTMVKPSNMAAVVSYTLPTFILAILALVLS